MPLASLPPSASLAHSSAPNPPLTVELTASLESIGAQDWDRLAGEASPLTSYAFLHALERSGSVDAQSGWISRHLLLKEGDRLVGLCPAYAKLHSYGEYVFDHPWAEAFERAGGRYYPKLQVAVPFTPATGRRLLSDPRYYPALAEGLRASTRQLQLSSAHVTFCQAEEAEALAANGFLTRVGLQFHWHNQCYETFDDFLAVLKSSKRKAIRKERREAKASSLRFAALQGDAIEAWHWDHFFAFYQDTSDRKWNQAYLTRDFFAQLHETLRDKMLLCLAFDGERPVAGALNFIGQNRLYGRYWGCLQHYKFLHFELCYYQAIDYAIAQKLEVVEAGAQGPHKLQRGYRPTLTYSSHWIEQSGLRNAVADFLERERLGLVAQQAELEREASPYAQTGGQHQH